MQRAAPGDVERLEAAADGENGNLTTVGKPGQRQLAVVELAPRRAEPPVRGLAIGLRIEVGTPGEAHAGCAVQQRAQHRAIGDRWDDHRYSAGGLDRPQVPQAERHLVLGGLRLGRRHRVAARSQLGRGDDNQRCCPCGDDAFLPSTAGVETRRAASILSASRRRGLGQRAKVERRCRSIRTDALLLTRSAGSSTSPICPEISVRLACGGPGWRGPYSPKVGDAPERLGRPGQCC